MAEYGREAEYDALAERLMIANETLHPSVRPSREYTHRFVRRSSVADARRFVESCENNETISIGGLVDVIQSRMDENERRRN